MVLSRVRFRYSIPMVLRHQPSSQRLSFRTKPIWLLQTRRSEESSFVSFRKLNYGDASSLTTFSSNGARHAAIGPTLGLLRDSDETNGVPTLNASSDDQTGIDDEDGVLSDFTLIAGQSESIQITVLGQGKPTYLNSWFDWNQDGDWNDTNEHVIDDLSGFTGRFRFLSIRRSVRKRTNGSAISANALRKA